MNLPLIFSLIFFIAFNIYAFFGIYIMNLNPKSNVNRTFFVVCLTLCIWTFSFAKANSALNYEQALFWRRVAAIGWGALYSCLLHFVLVLTEKKNILNKKRSYILLYLPALLNIFAFSIYDDLAINNYKLINTRFGWVNTSLNGIWDIQFNLYYAGFTLAGIGLMSLWGKATLDPRKKRQSKFMVMSFILALILGTLTEVVFNKRLNIKVPQLAPVIVLIPITAIGHSIRQYGLMSPIIRKQASKEDSILSESKRETFYGYLALAFVIGGAINLGHYYFFSVELKSVLIFSGLLSLIGLALMRLPSLKISSESQDTLMIAMVAMAIPLIMNRFANEYANNIVWPIPLIFMSIASVFGKKRMLLIIAAMTIVTQIWMWGRIPEMTISVGAVDHFGRTAVYLVGIVLACYINRIYTHRMMENGNQVKFQKMIAHISADFLNVDESNLSEKIDHILRLNGEHYQVDRTHLFMFSEDGKSAVYTNEWCADGIKSGIEISEELPLSEIKWSIDKFSSNGMVNIPDVDMIEVEAESEKNMLKSQGIQSVISIPVISKGRKIGFIGFDSVRSKRNWRDDHREILKILANLVADAMLKVEREKEINYMAYYDDLTGLPNHILFKNILKKAIESTKQVKNLIAVIFIDLDSFKSVNDTMGHEGGDELLKQVADRLVECVNKEDIVSRFGGDEFLIMVKNDIRIKDIQKTAENILRSFDQPLMVRGQEFYITASTGISIYPIDGQESEELIKNAELAMYSSKSEGKNQCTLCSATMKEDVLKKMRLTNSLYRVLERDELVLHYQPQVDIKTGEIVGLEALVRWNHPDWGVIPPLDFIPLAEQTGLINPIGDWVIETACRQNISWQRKGIPPVRMAVNLSVEQFRNPNLVESIDKILRRTGMKSKYLELEITESMAVRESDGVIEMLNKLKGLGAMIAIDDFGTEYSSLGRLKSLPADRIKIDRQFVQGTVSDKRDEAIVKAVIQLAKNLGLKVIAEGVEIKEQMSLLKAENCDEVQGYYYYRPMPCEEVEKIILDNLMESKITSIN